MKNHLYIEKLKSNIPKVYALNFFMMFLVTIPIIVPYWKSLGLNIKEVYQLQAIFGFMMIILDVPAGYISDLFGRKKCLIIVGVTNILTYSILATGKTFWHFAMFEVMAAIGYALYSGCDIALIYDSIDAVNEHNEKLALQKKEHHSKTYLGKRIFYSQVGESLASLLGGFLAVYSLSLPSKINFLTSFMPLMIALSLTEPPRKIFESKKHIENFKIIYESLFKHSRLLTLLILFNIVYSFSTFAAVWAYQSYWEAVKIPVIYFGMLWASFNFLVAIIARNSGRIEKRVNPTYVVLIIAIAPVIAYLGLAYSYHAVGTIFLFFFAITRALNGVVLQDGVNKRVPSTMRATTNSICSLGMRAIFFFYGPWFGNLIDKKGVHYSFEVMGYAFVAMFFILALPLLKLRKEFLND